MAEGKPIARAQVGVNDDCLAHLQGERERIMCFESPAGGNAVPPTHSVSVR
jgi:hypothetical protein